MDVQKITHKKTNLKKIRKNQNLSNRRVNFEGQNLPPLLLTNNSLTLSEKENEKTSKEGGELITIAERIVETFYSRFSQNPSTEKFQRGLLECHSLLTQGFTELQIRYALDWILIQYPDTGSFSRVNYLIDQALKAKEEKEQRERAGQKRNIEEEKKRDDEKKMEEEGRKIDEIKASLTESELNLFIRQARQLVESEQGHIRFGRETLVQLKLRQLIRQKFLL